MDNIFCTCTIMALRHPMSLNPECLTSECELDDAISKVHKFFHEYLKVPVVWLINDAMLEPRGETFRRMHQEYGDEFGIYESGIFAAGTQPGYGQDWPEKLGIKRPSLIENPIGLTWAEMPEDMQVQALGYLKKRVDDVIGQDTKLVYAANGGANTVRAMKKVGLEILWGYNWHLYGDFVDATGRGAPFTAFYVSDVHQKAAAPIGDKSVLGIPWGACNLLNSYSVSWASRSGQNNVCINAHEVANRSGDIESQDYIEKVITELVGQAGWNPFVHIPVQIEAVWIDEGGASWGQHPRFTSHTTEVFYRIMEVAIRHGAKVVTCGDFLKWYRENFDRTPETLHYSEDLLPGHRFRGKDQDYAPMLAYCSHERQMIFLKSHGFNIARAYSYKDVRQADDPRREYPYQLPPPVDLKIGFWRDIQTGVVVTPEKAYYSAEGIDMTADAPQPDYAFILWQANLPDYIDIDDLECTPSISRVKLLREKNIAVVFASLAEGDNDLGIRSDKPNKYIKIERQEISGGRCEIYIRNDGPEVRLHRLQTKIDSHLQIGGFWWDGKYHQSIFHYHYSPYNWRTGEMTLNTAYPMSLPLYHGTTRCSIELLGRLPENSNLP